MQYLQTDGLPFPRTNNRSMSRALLLLTTGLMMGATCVVSSLGALAPLAGVARALVGALAGALVGALAGASSSSSSEASEMLSMSMYSPSTGAGRTGARWTGAGWMGAGWTGAGWTGAGWVAAEGLGRGRGAMLGMCIEDDA